MVRVPPLARQIADRAARQLRLPPAFLRLRQAMSRPSASLAELSRAVSAEPELSGRILDMVNGPLGPGRELPDLSRCVNLLGVRNVGDVALAVAVTGVLEGLDAPVTAPGPFWRRSVRCALMARRLGARPDLEAEGVFLAGLFADVGYPLVEVFAPASVVATFAEIGRWEPDSAARQVEEAGCSHAQVAAALLDVWSVPPEIVDWVKRHPDPMDGGPLPDGLCITHICARVADAHAGGDLREPLLASIARDALQDCGVGPGELAALHAAVLAPTEQVLDAAFPTVRRCA